MKEKIETFFKENGLGWNTEDTDLIYEEYLSELKMHAEVYKVHWGKYNDPMLKKEVFLKSLFQQRTYEIHIQDVDLFLQKNKMEDTVCNRLLLKNIIVKRTTTHDEKGLTFRTFGSVSVELYSRSEKPEYQEFIKAVDDRIRKNKKNQLKIKFDPNAGMILHREEFKTIMKEVRLSVLEGFVFRTFEEMMMTEGQKQMIRYVKR